MTVIESDKIEILRKSENIYGFLNDLRNYAKLIPEDIGSVEAEEKEALLNVKGLGKFKISIVDTNPPAYIKLRPEGKLPFKFDIEWRIEPGANGSSVVQGIINAKLNAFIRMMAEPKLRDFVDKQAYRLKEFIENEIEK